MSRLVLLFIAFVALTPVLLAQQGLIEPQAWAARLDEKINVDIVDQPLGKTLADVAKGMGVDLEYDSLAIEELGLTLDELAKKTFTLKARAMTRRQVIELLLGPWELAIDESHESFRVTSCERNKSRIFARLYDVDALVEAIGRDSRRRGADVTVSDIPEYSDQDHDPYPRHRGAFRVLVNLLTQSVSPNSWKNSGGDGQARFLAGHLVIEQTAETHRKVAGFLAWLADALATRRPIVPKEPPPEWVVKLDEKIALDFVDQPFDKALEEIVSPTGAAIVYDAPALDLHGLLTREEIFERKVSLESRVHSQLEAGLPRLRALLKKRPAK